MYKYIFMLFAYFDLTGVLSTYAHVYLSLKTRFKENKMSTAYTCLPSL